MTSQGAALDLSQSSEIFDRLLSSRWSCRAFQPQQVPTATIERIAVMAQKTASWNNVQPWQIIITRGRGTERFRAALLDRAQKGGETEPHFPWPREYAGIYLERRRACGFQLYDAVGVRRGDKAAYARQTMRNFQLFDAPHVAIITSEEALGVYGAIDCGAYVSNFMLSAASLGVATIAQGALAAYAETIRNYFSLPESRLVVCGISFGFPDMSDPSNSYRVPRADIRDAVQFADE